MAASLDDLIGMWQTARDQGRTTDMVRVAKQVDALGGVLPSGPQPGDAADVVPPTAAFTIAPPAPGATVLVTFDGSASAAGDAPITGYGWQLGPSATRTGPVVTWRTPSGSGAYTCTLTVTAADGQTGQASQVITI